MIPPRLTPVDLTRGVGHTHPDIRPDGTLYLACVGGWWAVGSFSLQWYGLHFGADGGGFRWQFDAPGFNSSRWEHLFLFEDGYATYRVTFRTGSAEEGDEEDCSYRFRFPSDEAAHAYCTRVYGGRLRSVEREP